MRYDKWIFEKLKYLREQEESLVLIPEQIQTLELRLDTLKGTDYDKVIVSGGAAGNDAVLDAIAEKAVLERNLEIVRKEVTAIRQALSLLTEEEYQVIDCGFIRRHPDYIEELCSILQCEKTKIYEIRRHALIKLAKAMFGIAEV